MNYTIFIKVILICKVVLMPSASAAQGLHIGNTARVIMSGPVNLVLKDIAFTNDGNFTASNSMVLLTGIKIADLGGSNATAFFKLAIQKSSNNVRLTQNISVTNSIAMNGGNLLLNGKNVNLGSSGIITGELDGRSITGTNGGSITAIRSLPRATGGFVNPGNIGAELGNATSAGMVTVTRSHVQETLPNGTVGIQRKYNIAFGNGVQISVTGRFFYFDSELRDNTENDLIVWTTSGAGNFFIPVGKDSNNIKVNWVLKNNIGIPALFTLAAPGGAFSRMGLNPQTTNVPVNDKAQLYPNPAHTSVNLELIMRRKKEVVIKLLDESGKVLQQKQVNCVAGMNRINWDIHSYPNGTYFISFQNKAFKDITFVKK
jgi:Secretion system C-terminal sorting domain